MCLTFCPENNDVAFQEIKSGEYKQCMLDYLKEDNGQIVWGAEEKFVDKDTVYELFDLETDEEYINYESINSVKPSKLAIEFKKSIVEAYALFQEWQKDKDEGIGMDFMQPKIDDIKALIMKKVEEAQMRYWNETQKCLGYKNKLELARAESCLIQIECLAIDLGFIKEGTI